MLSLGSSPLVQAASGALDPTFGIGGVVITPILNSFPASGLAIQADGKLVVAANLGLVLSPASNLVRYNSDGSLDATFGKGTLEASSVVMAPSGRSCGRGERLTTSLGNTEKTRAAGHLPQLCG